LSPCAHDGVRQRLAAVEQSLADAGGELALFLVYDRPQRVGERPGLARTFFAQRCASDAELAQTIDAFRSVGAYVELFDGEHPLIEALASGRVEAIGRRLKVVYNGIQNYAAADGFAPGRKALLPALADAYGLVCTNSNAYGCAIGRHKFHYLTILQALGIPAPRTWHYRAAEGWAGGHIPAHGTKVIAKSTYESWSVGVTDDSIFVVDADCHERVAAIADAIGQPVTVQEFIAGTEVNVPVFACPDHVVTPPVRAVLAKAPGDPAAVVTIEDNLQHAALTYERFDAPAELIESIRGTALAAFKLLELQAFARVDFRVDEDGCPWVIDIGVEPGLAPTGSASRSMAQLGFDHARFLRTVIGAALATRGLLPSSLARSRPTAA
jgi:D-alanine-D-alanine ligase